VNALNPTSEERIRLTSIQRAKILCAIGLSKNS